MKPLRRNWTGCILFFGFIMLALVLCGCPERCPWPKGKEYLDKRDMDGDGKDDYLAKQLFPDEAGTIVEMWATANCWRGRYVPIQPMSPHAYWIGLCKYREGANRLFGKGTKDENKNGVPDILEKVDYANTNRETGITDGYHFDATADPPHLRVVRYESFEKFEKREDGEELYNGPAPENLKDLEEIDPPDEAESPDDRAEKRRSLLYQPLYFVPERRGCTWRYFIFIYKRFPMVFKAGDTIAISGEGIESACVHGLARKNKFGGWRLKELDWNYVTFEATRDATVGGAFGCFSVTAPQAKEGKVRWLWESHAPVGGFWDETLGPASVDE